MYLRRSVPFAYCPLMSRLRVRGKWPNRPGVDARWPVLFLVSIGSPPDVIAGARAHLTEGEFERRKQELQRAHPEATLIEQRETVRTESGQSYPGKLAVFEYEDVFAGSKIPVRSHLYVFCYVGGKWAVEYRFTRPKGEDADREIQEFIQKWSWYGHGVKETLPFNRAEPFRFSGPGFQMLASRFLQPGRYIG